MNGMKRRRRALMTQNAGEGWEEISVTYPSFPWTFSGNAYGYWIVYTAEKFQEGWTLRFVVDATIHNADVYPNGKIGLSRFTPAVYFSAGQNGEETQEVVLETVNSESEKRFFINVSGISEGENLSVTIRSIHVYKKVE